jgi:hypothetical protein
MMMSEYMSIKTLQYHEEQFRRELEQQRVIKERLAEQAEVNELEQLLLAEVPRPGRSASTRRQHWLSGLSLRHVRQGDPAHR